MDCFICRMAKVIIIKQKGTLLRINLFSYLCAFPPLGEEDKYDFKFV